MRAGSMRQRRRFPWRSLPKRSSQNKRGWAPQAIRRTQGYHWQPPPRPHPPPSHHADGAPCCTGDAQVQAYDGRGAARADGLYTLKQLLAAFPSYLTCMERRIALLSDWFTERVKPLMDQVGAESEDSPSFNSSHDTCDSAEYWPNGPGGFSEDDPDDWAAFARVRSLEISTRPGLPPAPTWWLRGGKPTAESLADA